MINPKDWMQQYILTYLYEFSTHVSLAL